MAYLSDLMIGGLSFFFTPAADLYQHPTAWTPKRLEQA
jgi:hypothetical protein